MDKHNIFIDGQQVRSLLRHCDEFCDEDTPENSGCAGGPKEIELPRECTKREGLQWLIDNRMI